MKYCLCFTVLLYLASAETLSSQVPRRTGVGLLPAESVVGDGSGGFRIVCTSAAFKVGR